MRCRKYKKWKWGNLGALKQSAGRFSAQLFLVWPPTWTEWWHIFGILFLAFGLLLNLKVLKVWSWSEFNVESQNNQKSNINKPWLLIVLKMVKVRVYFVCIFFFSGWEGVYPWQQTNQDVDWISSVGSWTSLASNQSTLCFFYKLRSISLAYR